MSSAPDPQDSRLEPVLPEAWLCELFAPSGAGASAFGGGADERPTQEQLSALRSAEGHLRALRSLPRLQAPEELDGRVVASLEAGFRQDRATGLVTGLQAHPAPEELAGLVEGQVEANLKGVGAPAVLERLVEERVEASAEGMVRSMAGRLDRKVAPSELDGRVLDPSSGVVAASPFRGRVIRRFAVAVSAAALLVVTARLVGPLGESASATPPLNIVRVQSLDAMSASALDRAFLASLTGEYPGGAR